MPPLKSTILRRPVRCIKAVWRSPRAVAAIVRPTTTKMVVSEVGSS